MDSVKEQQVVELIKTRPDLNYVQISFLTGTNLTAVHNIAKTNNCQRKRGRRPWKQFAKEAGNVDPKTASK